MNGIDNHNGASLWAAIIGLAWLLTAVHHRPGMAAYSGLRLRAERSAASSRAVCARQTRGASSRGTWARGMSTSHKYIFVQYIFSQCHECPPIQACHVYYTPLRNHVNGPMGARQLQAKSDAAHPQVPAPDPHADAVMNICNLSTPCPLPNKTVQHTGAGPYQYQPPGRPPRPAQGARLLHAQCKYMATHICHSHSNCICSHTHAQTYALTRDTHLLQLARQCIFFLLSLSYSDCIALPPVHFFFSLPTLLHALSRIAGILFRRTQVRDRPAQRRKPRQRLWIFVGQLRWVHVHL